MLCNISMKKLILLISVFLIISCTGNNKNTLEEKNNPKNVGELSNETNTSADPPKTEQKNQIKASPKLMALLEDGLIIADSTEKCSSQKWASDPRTKLVFNYPQGNKLILEEWEYSFNGDDLKLLDFHIYNCLTNEILLEARYTTADYEIIDVKPSLKIQINADIPTFNEDYSRQPFLIKTFNEIDSAIATEVDKIFKIPNLTKEEIAKISNEYYSRPTLAKDKELGHVDFATDELLIQLFKGAINGNEKADSLFFNISHKYALDGATAELYGDMKYLLNEAKK